MRILTVFGTRPEAIKLAPLIRLLDTTPGVDHAVCVTGQHREMLDQVLDLFGIKPQFDLNIMKAAQGLTDITTAVLSGLDSVLRDFQPTRILVQGDTTSAFAASFAAFLQKVSVGHVEAGLRTGNIFAPWPEEMNRRLTSQIADLHFCPTSESRDNLLREGIDPRRIEITGNTVIDALLYARDRITADNQLRTRLDKQFDFLDRAKRLILVTGHRRESFDGGLDNFCHALRTIAERSEVEIIYPVHLNPNVQRPAKAILSGLPNVHLAAPVDYLPFVYLMTRCDLIITDSGGVQEEAPSLGKPVLVTRETTERPEAVAAGTVKLVGTDKDVICTWTRTLLDDEAAYRAMSFAHNPYGDGKASRRIVKRILAGVHS